MITRINYHLRNTASSLRMAADELDKATQVGYESEPNYRASICSGDHGCGCNPSPTLAMANCAPIYESIGDTWSTLVEHLKQGNRIQAIRHLRQTITDIGLKDAKAVVDILYPHIYKQPVPVPNNTWGVTP